MSIRKVLQQAGSSDNEDRSSNTFTSFWRSGNLSQSAAPVKAVAPGSHYDFVSFLGVAQKLEIDFLPIT
jgi:hypothetical protein